jgi:hypothetical protein
MQAGVGSRPSSAARGVLPPTELNVQRLSAAHKEVDRLDMIDRYSPTSMSGRETNTVPALCLPVQENFAKGDKEKH